MLPRSPRFIGSNSFSWDIFPPFFPSLKFHIMLSCGLEWTWKYYSKPAGKWNGCSLLLSKPTKTWDLEVAFHKCPAGDILLRSLGEEDWHHLLLYITFDSNLAPGSTGSPYLLELRLVASLFVSSSPNVTITSRVDVRRNMLIKYKQFSSIWLLCYKSNNVSFF